MVGTLARAAAAFVVLVAFPALGLAQGHSHCPMHSTNGVAATVPQDGAVGQGHHGVVAGTADAHAADMEVFHYLLDHGATVRRTITRRPDGVDTLTESDDPEVAEQIRRHVTSMYGRVKDGRPVHMRDPLFRAVFAHADRIDFKSEATSKGVRVVETSSDPEVVALIQAHADVVSRFIANGRSEAMTDHDVPAATSRP